MIKNDKMKNEKFRRCHQNQTRLRAPSARLQLDSGAREGDAPGTPEAFNDCGGPRSSERLEGEGEAFRVAQPACATGREQVRVTELSAFE